MNKNYENYEDLEIKKSLKNLRLGQKEYMRKYQAKPLKSIYNQKKGYYNTYDPYSNNTYSSELNKNKTIYNYLLNSQNLTSTHYLNSNSYNRKSMVPGYIKTSRLSEIPPNPDDVVMKQLPPNYIISMNPISSSNLGMGSGMNAGQIAEPMMSQEISPPPQMIEEINTDIIPNGDTQQDEKIEEEPIQVEDNHEEIDKKEEEPQEETAPVQTGGKYQITEFNIPIKLLAGYSTDDEDEFNAIQFLMKIYQYGKSK